MSASTRVLRVDTVGAHDACWASEWVRGWEAAASRNPRFYDGPEPHTCTLLSLASREQTAGKPDHHDLSVRQSRCFTPGSAAATHRPHLAQSVFVWFKLKNGVYIFKGFQKKDYMTYHMWPIRSKLFTIWPFREKVCWLLFYIINCESNKILPLCRR